MRDGVEGVGPFAVDAQGAEALAVTLEGHLHGWFTAQEIVEDVTPAGGGVGLRICPSWRHDMI